jgi:putative sterol carrier protein
VPRFLSAEWIDRLDEAARSEPVGGSAAVEAELVIEQVVTDVPGVDEVRYRLRIAGTTVRVVSQPCGGEPTVTITVPYDTAVAINAGDQSAQGAFMSGRLRMAGDVGALLRQRDRLVSLDDLFAGVRADTTY